MQTNLLTSACMQGILMSLVANPINFASISVSGPLQIVILIYWPYVQKNGGSNYIWLPSPLRWRRWYLERCGLAKCVRRRTPLRETAVSHSQVPLASRDNRLICIQEVGWTKGRVNVVVLLVLPPFLFTPHIRFGQSQTTQSLTKFILKYIQY